VAVSSALVGSRCAVARFRNGTLNLRLRVERLASRLKFNSFGCLIQSPYFCFCLKQSLPEFKALSFGTGVKDEEPEGVEGALTRPPYSRRLP